MDKHSKKSAAPAQEAQIKEFLDMISPGIIKFNVDHFLCGNTYRCVWALREYPTATEEQAILRHQGEKDGVNTFTKNRRQVICRGFLLADPGTHHEKASRSASLHGRIARILLSLLTSTCT